MSGEFDIAETTWEKEGVLVSPSGAVIVPVVLDEEGRALDDYTDYKLLAGTPIAKIAGGTTYKPVRRDTILSSTYDTGAVTTAIVLDTDANPFVLGDVCQAYTDVDEAGTTLGAITGIDYTAATPTLTFAGDMTQEAEADDYLDVTETSIRDVSGEPGALILVTSVDIFNAAQRVGVDTPHAALLTGVIYGTKLLGPLSNDDAQLIADITGYMIPWVP